MNGKKRSRDLVSTPYIYKTDAISKLGSSNLKTSIITNNTDIRSYGTIYAAFPIDSNTNCTLLGPKASSRTGDKSIYIEAYYVLDGGDTLKYERNTIDIAIIYSD